MTLAVLAACRQSGGTTQESQKPTGESQAETSADTEETQAVGDGLPEDLKYDDRDFRILTYLGANVFDGNGWVLYLDIDEPAEGEPLEYAAYQRNVELREKRGITIDEQEMFRWNNLKEDIAYYENVIAQSGTDDYDVSIHQTSELTTLLIRDYLYDLNDLSYIDWDRSFYIQGMTSMRLALTAISCSPTSSIPASVRPRSWSTATC